MFEYLSGQLLRHSLALLLVFSLFLLLLNSFQAQVALITTNMTSGTVSSLVLLFLSCTQVFAQTGQTQQVSYNQVLNLNGDVSKPIPANTVSDTRLMNSDETQLVPIPRPFEGRDVLAETAADNR
jgi:hypothetical protein